MRARNYIPLVEVAEPYIVGNLPQPFQGYAAIGRLLYMLEGSNYGPPGSGWESPIGNTHITCVDLNTGTLVDRQLTKAGYTLDYREPEGMGVHLPTPSDPSTARLCFGFASGASGARKASIYSAPLTGDPSAILNNNSTLVIHSPGGDDWIWGTSQTSAGGAFGAWAHMGG